jgi:hypothetical protein
MQKLTTTLIITFIFCVNIMVKGNPVFNTIRVNKDTVGRYDKFEMQINLTANFQNPFDPDEIDLNAVFISPSGKQWKINGFYNYSDYGSLWMVRFSPNETGRWIYQLNVRDLDGSAASEQKSFFVVPSPYHGPVKIAPNKRYLEYADGTPYYGVGLWYNDSYQAFNQGQINQETLDHLKKLGVNFISSFMIPLETMGTGLGRYDQNFSGRLDEVLSWCEDRNINLSLNIWFHAFLSKTVWPGGNRRWETNPYQLVCNAKDFYSSKEAWTYQEKLYRYIIARWGYSRSLAVWFVVDEVNGTDGWMSGDSIGANNWAQNVQDYIKTHDPYNHLTTGTRSGGINEFWSQGYKTFDLAAREIYESQGFPINETGIIAADSINPLTRSYLNYTHEIKKLWNGYEKPAIIGETGWDHTFYEPSMPGYLSWYHNALWVCMANGTAMTPFWWAYSPYLNDNVITNQIRSFERFVSTIPFSKLTRITPTDAEISGGNAFAMKSDQVIFGWVVNPKTDVSGATVTVRSIPVGEYTLKIYHTWDGRFISENKIICAAGSVTFKLPVLHITDYHAHYLGQDAAFVLIPVNK